MRIGDDDGELLCRRITRGIDHRIVEIDGPIFTPDIAFFDRRLPAKIRARTKATGNAVADVTSFGVRNRFAAAIAAHDILPIA